MNTIWKRNYYSSLLKTVCNYCNPRYEFGNYSLVKPGFVSPSSSVPKNITKPNYFYTSDPDIVQSVNIKTGADLIRMRKSCKLAASILKKVEERILVGQTTDDIDKFVHKIIVENNAYPSPLKYKSFPKSICTSVNNVACHGIPDDRQLEDGDIINVDITVYLDGYHGDCSKTFLVGNVDELGRDLVYATEKCLNEAILICRPGIEFRAIGATIELTALELGFNVVPCFIGHGVGKNFHEPPDIYHFANYEEGVMRSGMTFTIEPVLTQGQKEIEILEDGWTAVTLDEARTAQFEHTVLITDNGVEILTLPD